MSSLEAQMIAAAEARAAALAAGDAEALEACLHPRFSWTSRLGESFDRDGRPAPRPKHTR